MVIESISALLSAFGIIFLAELGDKTQLIILTLATQKHSPKKLALGATLGFAVIVFLGGFISSILTEFIDMNLLVWIAACVFIILGVIQIISLIKRKIKSRTNNEKLDANSETEELNTSRIESKTKNTFFMGFLAIVLMEMGDKTQIMTVLLASTSVSFYGTLIGAWLALSILAVIGAFMGEWVAKRIPKHILDWVSSILFIMIGIFMFF